MKKILSLIAVVVMVLSIFNVAVYGQNSVTDVQTVKNSATVKFTKKFGMNHRFSPTPPIEVNNTLIVVSGNYLYKLDAQTGEEISVVQMTGSTFYAIVSPLYYAGVIYVQLDGGIVQAFDFETMESLWVYKDSLGGQALCPITYDNGYIYTGFWNGETDYANYVCISTKDEDVNQETENKQATWTYKSLGGFYWAGCSVAGNYVVVGCDNGQQGYVEKSKIVSLDKYNGDVVYSLDVMGDIRSSVVYQNETNSCYASSKSGYVYRFNIDLSSGKIDNLKFYTADGSITSTPVVYNNRLYVGVQYNSQGRFVVLDAETMKEIYHCDMLGYPQATMLLTTGYVSDRGKVYIYSTYNNTPGGITVFEDCSGQTVAKKEELFIPDANMSEYCISTICAGEQGTLYYKNDSGYIFALSEKTDFISVLKDMITFLLSFAEKIKMIFRWCS